MLAVIVFIIILGLLIFVHELGHFLTARRNGIKADEFGFGFPPRILGIQSLSGQEKQKSLEVESIEKEIVDIKSGKDEIVKETITEKMRQIVRLVDIKKWRIIWGNKDGDNENEKKDLREAHQKKFAGGTIYSLNWIPLGGFVKIKGEDGGNKKDKDSFAGKSAWVRTKVLAAGVLMNFVLAWFLISIVMMIGAPEATDTDKNIAGSKIQISEIISGSPAENSGIKVGDEIVRTQNGTKIDSVKDFQDFVSANKGKEISLSVKRGREAIQIKITPRADTPDGEGPLGVGLAQTSIVKYPWYEAIWIGFKTTLSLVGAIFVALGGILKNLFMGNGMGADVAGPVGIAILTGEVTKLGLVYILQFTALLSINLGIINALPIPALDGGRILFILIEKIKGSAVSQKVEQIFHTVGFILLIILLVLVSFKDVLKLVK